MENIKKCPFCGGAGILTENFSFKTRSYFIFVKCQLCGAQSKTYASLTDAEADDWQSEACEKAIAAWNTRTAEEAPALPDGSARALQEVRELAEKGLKHYEENKQKIESGEVQAADEEKQEALLNYYSGRIIAYQQIIDFIKGGL